jgi:hypothetical protein
MTETEIPQMHLSRDHIMAMTQVLTMLNQRLAEQRERRGRAAYGNAEHAARIADTQENPVLRPMTDPEHQAFTSRTGEAQPPAQGLTVATAPVGQEWRVRAVAPTGDYATVMCPTISDAARLADYLRAENNPAAVNELNELSEQIGHRVAADKAAAAPAQPEVGAATTRDGEASERPRLADLATDLPASVTTTPEWERTEARFGELTAQGVDPAALAAGVQGLDFDRARRPDALVRWSLDQTAQAWEAEHPQQAGTHEDSREATAVWARQLDPTSAVDRAAAGEAVGRYGQDIDATLATTYPGLLTAPTDARTMAEWANGAALSQQQRENAEALTAESASHTLRGDDVRGGQGGEEDLDREEAAIVADGEAAEHRGRESEAGSEAERARDDKVTAQFTPTPTTATTATTATKVARRPATRSNPPVPVPTQTRTRGRGR